MPEDSPRRSVRRASDLVQTPMWPRGGRFTRLSPSCLRGVRVGLVAAAKRAWDWGSYKIDGGRGSGAKPAAEKGLLASKLPEDQTAGAEALVDSAGLFVGVKTPTYQSRPTARLSFSAACKALVDFAALAAPFDSAQGRLLKSCPFKARTPSVVSSYWRTTAPPFITKLTRSTAVMSSRGLPGTAIMSAK